MPAASDVDRRTAYVVIEAHATWASFCRFFFVSCALGASDGSGRPVLPRRSRHSSEGDAIDFAINHLRPTRRKASGPWAPRDEPTWFESVNVRKLVAAMGCSNARIVSEALALAPGSLTNLTIFRNFYAHRGRATVRKAQAVATRYLLISSRHPTAILNDYPPGRPQTLLRDLIDDLDTVIQLMN